MGKIVTPEAPKQQSIGRRLFSIAAPIVGGIYGGPAGAAAGSALASKVNGSTTQGALMSGLQTGVSEKLNAKPEAVAEQAPIVPTPEQMPSRAEPMMAQNAFGRRLGAASQNPQVGINEGLNVLASLPKEHPLRKDLTAPLVQAQFAAKGIRA